MTSIPWGGWRAPLALGFALVWGAPYAATAQIFFQPFAYTYRYEIPPDDPDEAPRFSSRRAVARILAREGYQLVGPLGQRGEQIVARGVSRRDGEMRFFIDPYEGQVIRAVRIGPPPQFDREPPDGGRVIEPLGGSRSVVRDYGGEPNPSRARGSSRRVAPATAREEAPRDSKASRPREVAAPSPVRPNPIAPSHSAPRLYRPEQSPPAPAVPSAVQPQHYPPATGGTPGSSPIPAQPAPTPPTSGVAPAAPGAEAVKSATPAALEDARPSPAPRQTETARPPASPHAAEAAKLAAPAPAPRPTAARSTGGSSRRAIVPPATAAGTTTATPTAPATPAGASRTPATVKTPDSSAKSKAGG